MKLQYIFLLIASLGIGTFFSCKKAITTKATITGILQDQDKKTAIAEAVVVLSTTPKTDPNYTELKQVITKADGKFTFTDLEPKTYYIYSVAEGYLETSTKTTLTDVGTKDLGNVNLKYSSIQVDLNNDRIFSDLNNDRNLLYDSRNGSEGQKTTQQIFIKNGSTTQSISWTLNNLPTCGIRFSPTSGTLAPGTETNIMVSFQYPAPALYSTNVTQDSVVKLFSPKGSYDYYSYSPYHYYYYYYYDYVWNWGTKVFPDGKGVSGAWNPAYSRQSVFFTAGGDSYTFLIEFAQYKYYNSNTLD